MKKQSLAMEYDEAGFSLNVSAIEVKFTDRERLTGVVFVNGCDVARLSGCRFSPRRRQYMTWDCEIPENDETTRPGHYYVAVNKPLHECLAMVVWDLARRTSTFDVETPEFVGLGWFGERDENGFSWNVREFIKPQVNPQVVDHRDKTVMSDDDIFTNGEI